MCHATPTLTVHDLLQTPRRRPPRPRPVPAAFTCLPDQIHVVCYPDTDEGEFGIVLIRGQLFAFLYEYGDFDLPARGRTAFLHFARAGHFGRDVLTTVTRDAGRSRWECNQCRTHGGLKPAAGCDHCEAARLIELYRQPH
jgi:hypothetical protein